MKLPQPGEILEEKYQLEGVLGQGAFGLVFRATTLSTNRPVAVKVLKPAPDSRSGSRSARFLRELRTIANLQCPNTLTLYDYGRTADGVLFMVTEFIEGEDLYDLINRRGRLEEHEVIHVLHQTLLSLAEAHELNVLHRDIKPHNIRVSAFQGDPLRVKVLDFGLSKSLEDDQSDSLTGAGLIVGTPRYMSPEQLRGKDLTPASDIYSLGLVAYEMLLGRPAVPLDAMVGQTRQIQLTSDDHVTRALREVVNQMLRRPLAERFRTAGEVLTALRPLRARGPVDADEEVDTVADTLTVTEVLGERAVRPRRDLPTRPNKWANAGPIVGGVVAVAVLVFGAMQIWRTMGDTEEDQPTIRPVPNQLLTKQDPTPSVVAAPDEPEVPVPAEIDAGTTGGAALAGDGCRGLERYEPGVQYISRLIGITRERALVRIPQNYDPSKRYGLVWLFHDYANTAEDMLNGLEYESVGNIDDFIVLAPQADKIMAWATKHEFETARVGLDVTRELTCLDPARFYVWGHGFGARVATRRAMCMDSVTAVATTAYRERLAHKLCEPERKIPYLHIGVTRDPIAPVDGGGGCYGHLLPADAPSLVEHEEFFKRRYDCVGPQKDLPRVKHGECYTWQCGTPFESCRIEGGRNLPNIPTRPMSCTTTAAPFPFTRTAFDFFSKFRDLR